MSCIHFFYSAGPVERSQSQSVVILHFFCRGGLGTGVINFTSKRGYECGSPQYLKGEKYLQVSLYHVTKFQKTIGTHVDQFTVFYHSKCLVDCRIQPVSLKLFLAKK